MQKKDKIIEIPSATLCPVCGNKSVVRQEGCKVCLVCGWSAC